jgi:hypothetical protein
MVQATASVFDCAFHVASEQVLSLTRRRVAEMVTELALDQVAKCAESSATARSPQDLRLSLPDNALRAPQKWSTAAADLAPLDNHLIHRSNFRLS